MRGLIMAAQQQARVSLDIDLQIYLDSLTTPLSSPQIALLNTFVTDLKTGLGIARLYDAFDQMLIHANETIESGLHNLVKRSHDATLSPTAPAFTALEGFTGNGPSVFINTNYNPATQGVNYTLNNASFGCYIRTDILNNKAIMGGASGAVRSILYPNHSTGNITYKGLNDKTYFSVPMLDSLGMYIVDRPVDNLINLYKNKSLDFGATNAVLIPNYNMYVLAYNNSGAAAGNDTRQVAFTFYGKSLTEAQAHTLTDVFQAYMTANGKQV